MTPSTPARRKRPEMILTEVNRPGPLPRMEAICCLLGVPVPAVCFTPEWQERVRRVEERESEETR